MATAFGVDYLAYTIYQAPESANYLYELLAQGPDSPHCFTVAAAGGGLLGFYYVVRRGDELFHPYMAVAPHARRQGLARVFMLDYEAVGRAQGFRRLGFDVFASNRHAYEFYLRLGYQVHATSWLVRLALADLAAPGAPPLHFTAADWAAARQEEAARGFSKVECTCGSGRVTVGLIAGSVCKLLDYEGISLDDALRAIGARFAGERTVLLVGGLPAVSPDWPVLSSEESLRCVMDI